MSAGPRLLLWLFFRRVFPLVLLAVIIVENGLHLVDGLEPGAAYLDAELLVKQRAVEALNR
jgi:hypothetical protein